MRTYISIYVIKFWTRKQSRKAWAIEPQQHTEYRQQNNRLLLIAQWHGCCVRTLCARIAPRHDQNAKTSAQTIIESVNFLSLSLTLSSSAFAENRLDNIVCACACT